MSIKSPLLVVCGLLGMGVLGGGTVALMQRGQIPPPAANVTVRSSESPIQDATPSMRPSTPPTIAPPSSQPPSRTFKPDSSVKSVIREVQSCRILMAIVNDSNPPLNVRSQPNVETGKVIGTLPDGAYVSVKREENGWFEITEPVGWIAKSKTVSRCGEKVERVMFAPGTTGGEIADEFMGSGSHRYQLDLAQGQSLTLKGEVGPTPALIAPNGQYLVGMDDQPKGWSQKLPASGTYILEMDSNFRGYKYAFTLSAQ